MLADLGWATEERVEVLVLTPRGFRAATGAPPWVRGAFDGRILVSLAGDGAANPVEALRPVLLHELAHQVLRSAVPAGLPPWFEEGLAERFEGNAAEAAAAWLQARRAPPFAGLGGIDGDIRAGGWREDAGHQWARLAVQALEELAGADAAARILALARTGETFGQALERVLPGGGAALEARLHSRGARGR